MPSIGTQLAQNLTRCFVVTQDAGNGEVGAYYFTQEMVDTWLSNNSGKIVNLGKTLKVIPGVAPGTTFADVVEGNNGAYRLGGPGAGTPTYGERKTLIDMGKEIIIGNSAEPRSLVLRYLKTPADSVTGQDAIFAYFVVENNCSDIGGNTGRFTVRVARI